MKDYRKLVSRNAPDGLIGFALPKLCMAGLVYETTWAVDDSMAAVLSDEVKKRKMVRITCSECGRSAVLEYAPPVHTWIPKKPTYGFYHPEYPGEGVRHGDDTTCPICGTEVNVRLSSKVGRGEFVADETVVMSSSLLPGEPGERPLVLTVWQVRRNVNRYGYERYKVEPLEAYVFERMAAYKLMGWVNSYSGSCGYRVQVCREWRQPKRWSESFGLCRTIFGLTPELMEESCLHNSKFDVYMKDHTWINEKSPVPYLRLYQMFPQVENLIVRGAGYLLNEMLCEAIQQNDWEANCRGLPVLPDLWLEGEVRPAQMLGLTKEEFRACLEQHWGLYHLRIYVKAKMAGDRMRIPEDITLLHRYGGEDVDSIIGQAPVGKTLRYLLRQIEAWGAANDPYNEYEDYMPEDDRLNAAFLADYWRMADEAGWDLSVPDIRWPRKLITAHDRAMAAQKVRESTIMRKAFRVRWEALGKYCYASGDLMIFPAASQKELNQEGQMLHHCVAGYGKDHAAGKTAIFFIRRVSDPETPYFTLELDEKKQVVRQNRGKHNCARTEEVQAFEAEWLAWIKKGCKREKDGSPIGARPPEHDSGKCGGKRSRADGPERGRAQGSEAARRPAQSGTQAKPGKAGSPGKGRARERRETCRKAGRAERTLRGRGKPHVAQPPEHDRKERGVA